jgi:hypothetical protein
VEVNKLIIPTPRKRNIRKSKEVETYVIDPFVKLLIIQMSQIKNIRPWIELIYWGWTAPNTMGGKIISERIPSSISTLHSFFAYMLKKSNRNTNTRCLSKHLVWYMG